MQFFNVYFNIKDKTTIDTKKFLRRLTSRTNYIPLFITLKKIFSIILNYV